MGLLFSGADGYQLHEEYASYLTRIKHVSVACRLSFDEERALLRGMKEKETQTQTQAEGEDKYPHVFLTNRSRYLRTLADNARCVCMYVCECVCGCVCERESEYVCECVCVGVKERE